MIPIVFGGLRITIHGDVATWLIASGTFLLAGVTGVLAWAAWRALAQLHVGVQQLAVTVEQLAEAKKDRHIQVLADFGRRWDEPALTEAQILAPKFGRAELAKVVDMAYRGKSWNPFKNRDTQQANVYLNVLLRIPNFYEDLASVVHEGTLDLASVSKSYKAVATLEWDYWSLAMARIRQEDRYAYLVWNWSARWPCYRSPLTSLKKGTSDRSECFWYWRAWSVSCDQA
jgi:hypothetical protein